MADYTPIYAGGTDPFTATTSAAVVGGRLLAVSGDGTVAHAAADSTVVVGVAAHDAASGGRVAVWLLEGLVHEFEATGAIVAGGGVNADAAGKVKASGTGIPTQAAAGALLGTALTTAAGSPLTLSVQGRR